MHFCTMKRHVLLIIIFLFVACTQKEKKRAFPIQTEIKPLPPDSMEMLMRDVYLTESYVRWSVPKGNDAKELTNHFYTLLFQKYHIDSTRFISSLKYYASNEDTWSDMISRVLNERLYSFN